MGIRSTAGVPGLALLLTLLAGGACGLSRSEAADQDQDAPPPAPARVDGAAARGGGLRDAWVFLGEVQALQRAELAAGADGEVRRVTVRVGDRVAQGDLLVQVDSRLAKARVAAASASRSEGHHELAQAKRDRERAERLGTGVLPQAEIEQDVTRATSLEAHSEQLHAAEREAKAVLGRHRVVAPFAGVVAARHVDPGDWVGPGDPVVDLVDDRQVEVIVGGSAALVERIAVGDAATIRRGRSSVEAEIAGIVPALDPATRTAKVRLVPLEPVPWLLPGVSVDVSFEIERGDEGVVVPRDALVYGAIDVRVMKVVDGAAQPVVVTVVATADDEAMVKGDGLAVGDEVVIRGNERLRPGQPITVVQP